MVELPFRPISSRENPTYKKIRALREPRKAHQAGLILVEGFRQVEEAVAAGITPQWLLLSPTAFRHERWPALAVQLAEKLQKTSFECLNLDDRLFADLVATTTPQGIALVAESPLKASNWSTEQGAEPDGLYLVLESIQDPGNLGTMIRTADAFAFTAVILVGATADPYGDKALRAAMGSTFHVRLLQFPAIEPAAAWLRAAGVQLIAADLSGEELTTQTILSRPAAMLIGNEGNGLSPQAIQLVDRRLKIMMPGRAESLNAAAAAAIFCHQFALAARKK